MTDVDRLLRRLSNAAGADAGPRIDVRARVLRSVSGLAGGARLNLLPIAFSATALAIAAASVIAVLPAWEIMTDPWVSYFPEWGTP